jgi:CDP-diacylglycerol---glycerol-3-phosphate 3-phosphatidyltransferase
MARELAFLLAVLAAAGFSMMAFAWTGGGRDPGDKTGRGGSFFLGYWVRNWFYWVMRPATRAAVALRLNPFFFNAAAVMFGAASMVFFAVGKLPSAGWMILLSGLADVMDGEVARGRGRASRAGAFLDSTLDRFSEFAVFIGLAAFFGSGWRSLAVLVALGGSLLVSYTRARGESLGVLCKSGLMQRAERILLLGVGAIVDPSLSRALGREPGAVLAVIVTIIAAGTAGTAIYRTIWISRKLEKG